MEPDVELKPCPFCGKPPKFVERHDFERGVAASSVQILGCFDAGCPANPSVEAPTREQAKEEWNRRGT